MNTDIKMTGCLYAEMIHDLSRPHPFAAERVGFAFGRVGSVSNGNKIILLNRFHSIPDDQYLADHSVGARIGPEALTWAMQAVYRGRAHREGIFHVHLHGHKGPTRMSATDMKEIPRLIPGFQSVGRDAAHGILILSADHGSCWVWMPGSIDPVLAKSTFVVGVPVRVFEHEPIRKPAIDAEPKPVGAPQKGIARRVWTWLTEKWR